MDEDCELAPYDTNEMNSAVLAERIRVHDLGQDLDEDLTRIINQTFSVTEFFDEKHNKLFSSIGATFTSYKNPEYEAYLEEGLKIYELFEKIFKDQAHAKTTWQAHLFTPLIRLSCLNGCPSGLLKYEVAESINISKETRKIFSSGIAPDICDGWMHVRSTSMTKDGKRLADKVMIDGQPVYITDLPKDCMACGDQLLKMIDLLVEINGSDVAGLELDKSKLLCEMVVSSQCFIQVLKINPYTFGLTTAGPEVRIYALKATNKLITEQTSSLNQCTAPNQQTDEWQYDCYFLENITITGISSFMRLFNILWRIRERRADAVVRWILKARLRPAVKMTKYTVGTRISNSINNTTESQVEGDEYFLEVGNLQEYGFGGVEIISNNQRSLVVRAMYSDSPCVVKLFKKYSDYEAEKEIYDWLNNNDFPYKPRLSQTVDIGLAGLVLELLECVQERQINKSYEDIVTFAFKLLQSVEALHACNVVHGDIKLSNLAYDEASDSIKLFDFAYSEILHDNTEVERRGYTEGYLPECSGPISFRDDLCNVGAILFRLIYNLAPSDVGYDNLVVVMSRSNIEVHPLLAQLVRTLIDSNQGLLEAYNNYLELIYRNAVFAELQKRMINGGT